MRSLKFRYTLGSQAEVVQRFLQKSEAYIVIRHDADEEVSRDHWHAWVRTTKTVETFRAQFKKEVGEIAKEDYSIGTIKDGEDEVYIRYMCHCAKRGDVVHLVCMQAVGYDQEKLQQLHEEFWIKRETFVRQKKKGRSLNAVEQLLDYCKTNNVDIGSRRAVTGACFDMFEKQNRNMSFYYLESVINCVICKTPQGRNALVERMMAKWENNF